MKLTPESKERIARAVNERLPAIGSCSLCGHTQWVLGDGITLHAVQQETKGHSLGGPGMPCIPLVCGNCGNTHFLNLLRLGLGDLFEE